MSETILIERGLRPEHRQAAAALFWEAFGAKLARVLGPDARALGFIEEALDPAQCLAAVDTDGRLLGIAGIKTAEGAFVGGGMATLAAIYGWFGALWRVAALSLMERRQAPGILLMDGIAVAAAARGRGVGTLLLAAVEREAARRGDRAVRLHVIDANPRARALYEARGYLPAGEQHLGPLRAVFGFGHATTMIKRLAQDADAAP